MGTGLGALIISGLVWTLGHAMPSPVSSVSGCPASLINGQHVKVFGQSCFLFALKDRKTRHEAEKTCESDGGSLVMIKSHLLERFVRQKLSRVSWSHFWIGLQLDEGIIDYNWEEDESALTRDGRSEVKDDDDSEDRDDDDDEENSDQRENNDRDLDPDRRSRGSNESRDSGSRSSGSGSRRHKKHGHHKKDKHQKKTNKKTHKKADKYLYKWEDGTPMSYHNFASYMNQRQNTNRKCVTIDGKLGQWHQVSCVTKLRYICQYPLMQTVTAVPTTSITRTTTTITSTATTSTTTSTTTTTPTTPTTTTTQKPTSTILPPTKRRVQLFHPSIIEPTPKVISVVAFD